MPQEEFSFNDPALDIRYKWKRDAGRRARAWLYIVRGDGKLALISEAEDRRELPSACFEPLTMEVLGCFLRHPNELLDRARMEKEIWGKDRSGGSLEHYVGCIRKLLLDTNPVQVPKDRRHPDDKSYRTLETLEGAGYRFLLPVDPPASSPVPPKAVSDLAAALNLHFQHLHDPNFGNDLLKYLEEASPDGVYCRDLDTEFTFQNAELGQFKDLAPGCRLLKECFQLTIKETVSKICTGNTLRFSVFLDAQKLAEHVANPQYDFVWHIDLHDRSADISPRDVFQIDWIRVVDNKNRTWKPIATNDPGEFAFEVDISDHSATALAMRTLKLSYQFQTLKSKAFRHVSYSTRFLTRGMTVNVDFSKIAGIRSESVYMSSHFSGLDKLEPERFKLENRRAVARGWLYPKSGVSFIYRYDEGARFSSGNEKDSRSLL